MEEFIHPVEEAATPDDQLPPEERQKRKNERLLEACMANETDKALQALADGADACYEDEKHWTPLSWACLNGNLPLVRRLLAAKAAQRYQVAPCGAARSQDNRTNLNAASNESCSSPYVSSQPTPDGNLNKYTPLHWAAYKGHLRIVWLLLKNGLSPHATDILGNTVLHQAVAGGSLPVVKTVLSTGVEVHAVNKRGHTALEVACDEDVKAILRAAASAVQCSVTGEYFSCRVPRYLCSFTEKFYARRAVKCLWLYDSPEAEEKEKPVTWCEQVHQAVNAAEKRLMDILQTDSLEKLNRALQSAADLPVCPKLLQQIHNKKLKLEGELALSRAVNLPVMVQEDDYFQAINCLKAALATAESREISDERCAEAKRLLRRLEVELNLTTLIKKPHYENFMPNFAFMDALAEATAAAKELGVTSPVLSLAMEMKERTEKHLTLKARIDASEEVSSVQDFFELKAEQKALLPDWAKESAKLEDVVVAFRREIADAKAAGVSEELIGLAEGGRLRPLETLLIEMKRRDEERLMKKARKKSVKKKVLKK